MVNKITEYIYHRCLKAEIGWFQAYGWELVREYREYGLDMALLRHTEVEEPIEEPIE